MSERLDRLKKKLKEKGITPKSEVAANADQKRICDNPVAFNSFMNNLADANARLRAAGQPVPKMVIIRSAPKADLSVQEIEALPSFKNRNPQEKEILSILMRICVARIQFNEDFQHFYTQKNQKVISSHLQNLLPDTKPEDMPILIAWLQDLAQNGAPVDKEVYEKTLGLIQHEIANKKLFEILSQRLRQLIFYEQDGIEGNLINSNKRKEQNKLHFKDAYMNTLEFQESREVVHLEEMHSMIECFFSTQYKTFIKYQSYALSPNELNTDKFNVFSAKFEMNDVYEDLYKPLVPRYIELKQKAEGLTARHIHGEIFISAEDYKIIHNILFILEPELSRINDNFTKLKNEHDVRLLFNQLEILDKKIKDAKSDLENLLAKHPSREGQKTETQKEANIIASVKKDLAKPIPIQEPNNKNDKGDIKTASEPVNTMGQSSLPMTVEPSIAKEVPTPSHRPTPSPSDKKHIDDKPGKPSDPNKNFIPYFDYRNALSNKKTAPKEHKLGKTHVTLLKTCLSEDPPHFEIAMDDLENLLIALGGRVIGKGGSRTRYELQGLYGDIVNIPSLHGRHGGDLRNGLVSQATVLQFGTLFRRAHMDEKYSQELRALRRK